jgi:NTP pyrophosphatase (non-canonical NTP hydrolase)
MIDRGFNHDRSTGTVLPLVIEDLGLRARMGVDKYGCMLQLQNGRDALRDAYEEALDLVMYLRQVIGEQMSEVKASEGTVGQGSQMQTIQEEHAIWSARNFGSDRPAYQPLLGAVEELGELAHAHLKQEQNIRGDSERHEEEAMDAIGDIAIYLIDYCNLRGWSFEAIIMETWERVSARDWKLYPENGVDA